MRSINELFGAGIIAIVIGTLCLINAAEPAKLSELNYLKLTNAEKDKEIAQARFAKAQSDGAAAGELFKNAQVQTEKVKTEICKEAGFKECSYDLASRVVTEVKVQVPVPAKPEVKK